LIPEPKTEGTVLQQQQVGVNSTWQERRLCHSKTELLTKSSIPTELGTNLSRSNSFQEL
jgi:hypothetical protein